MAELDGPRPCRLEELDELLDLINFVFRTSRGRPPNIGDVYRHVYAEDNLEFVRVIRIDGAIRASVGLFPFELASGEHTISALGVNCTTCHPDWRRRGLGELLMNDAAHLAEQGNLDLIHLAGGVPDWYRKLGYEQAGSRYRYLFDRGNIELLPKLDCEVVTGVDQHLEDVHDLHIAQRSGNMRSIHNTRLSFSRYPGELLAAQMDGKLKAHLYTDFSNNVLECAGEPAELVAGLTRELFQRRDREKEGASTTARDPANKALRDVEVMLEVSPLRTDLIAMLDTFGIPCERSFWHMVRVTDPPALAAKLGFEGSIVPTGGDEAFTVTTDLGEEMMTRGTIGRLLFGPERFPLRTQSPIPLFAPSTDHV